MGNVNKTATTIINESITDQSTRILNERFVPIDNKVQAVQDLNVEVKIDQMYCCDANFEQEQKIMQETINELDLNDQEDITKELEKLLKADITNRAEQELKDIPLGVNKNDVRNYVRNYDYHDLSLRVANKLVVDVNSQLESVQRGDYKITIGTMDCCEGGRGISVGQTMDVSSIVKNVVTSKHVTAAVNDISLTVDAIVSNESDQSAKGFNPAFWLFMIMLIPVLIMALAVAAIVT